MELKIQLQRDLVLGVNDIYADVMAVVIVLPEYQAIVVREVA